MTKKLTTTVPPKKGPLSQGLYSGNKKVTTKREKLKVQHG